jgi:hypothetical protein
VRPKVEAYIGGDYRQMSQRQLHCDNPSRAYVYDESELLHYDGSRGATASATVLGMSIRQGLATEATLLSPGTA